MGQYLMVGLRLGFSMDKEDIAKVVNEERTVEDILRSFERYYLPAPIYRREEQEDTYVYSLDKALLDKELMPFLERFYDFRYITRHEKEKGKVVLDLMETLPSTDKRLEVAKRKEYDCYQWDRYLSAYYVDDWRIKRVLVRTEVLLLSFEGKILMECYDSLFDFFRRSIINQFPDFEIAKTIDVYING